MTQECDLSLLADSSRVDRIDHLTEVPTGTGWRVAAHDDDAQRDSVEEDDGPTLRFDVPLEVDRSTAATPGLLTLLFELSLAIGLPPEELFAPDGVVRPVVRTEPHAVLRPAQIAALLDRQVTEVGRGRVAAGELDERLRGLAISLDVFRASDQVGAVISIGLVGPDAAADPSQAATVGDLWRLATAALIRRGIASERLLGYGEAAFLAVHSRRTAQLCWLDGERLATVSVTTLSGDVNWAVEAAHRIGALAEECLARRDGPTPRE